MGGGGYFTEFSKHLHIIYLAKFGLNLNYLLNTCAKVDNKCIG